MSYTSPKYTYVSNQPAFDQLRQDAVDATKTLAATKEAARAEERKKLEEEKKKGELLTSKAGDASTAYVRSTLSASPDNFTDFGRGVVQNYFKGKGARVGELVMATSGPNRKCAIDGNCEELELELARLQEEPQKVLGMLTTLSDQLDWKSIDNFDASQNPELVAVSSILQGIDSFGREPYGYEMVEGPKGSIDFVFKGPTDVFPGDDNNKPGEYKINSEQLAAATGPGGATLFHVTPKPSAQEADVLQNTEIIAGGTYDDNGVYQAGTGTFVADEYLADVEDGDFDPENYVTYIDANGTQRIGAKIDESKVRKKIKQGVAQTLETNFGIGTSGNPGIQDGEIRTYWNKVLSTKGFAQSAAENYDEAQLREVFNDQESSVEELKTRFGNVFTNWSTKEDLTEDQLAVFKELYLKQQTLALTMQLQNHPGNRVNVQLTKDQISEINDEDI